MSQLEKIIEKLNSYPSYMVSNALQLAVTILSGIIVGLIGSLFFSKADEVTRVEGLLLEKKLPIYKKIYAMLESLNEMITISNAQYHAALRMLEKADLKDSVPKKAYIAEIFTSPKKLKSKFLEFESFAVENKIFFDDSTAQSIIVFQNYFSIYNHIHAQFMQGLYDIDDGKLTDKKKIKKIEKNMFIAIGLVMHDDFFKQTQIVTRSIQNNLNNLNMKHRKAPRYNYNYYSGEKGYVHQHLKDTLLIKKQKEINELIMEYMALAMTAMGNNKKGK